MELKHPVCMSFAPFEVSLHTESRDGQILLNRGAHARNRRGRGCAEMQS